MDEMYSENDAIRLFKEGGNIGTCIGAPVLFVGFCAFVYCIWFRISYSTSDNAAIMPLFALIGLAIAFIGINQLARTRGATLNQSERTVHYWDLAYGKGDNEIFHADDLEPITVMEGVSFRHTGLTSAKYSVVFVTKDGRCFDIRSYEDKDSAQAFATELSDFLSMKAKLA